MVFKLIRRVRILEPAIKEKIRFIIAGATTAALLWGCLIYFIEVLDVNYLVSNTLSTLIAWCYAFFVNKFLVFKNKEKKYLGHASKYLILQAILLGWTNIVLYVFVGIVGVNYLFVAIGNAMLLVIINFIIQKKVVFHS